MSTLLVLPRPSRFDKTNNSILAGPARQLVDETITDYEVCYSTEFVHRRNSFSHIILTGQESLDQFQTGLSLTAHRGFVYHLGNQKLVATFWPQDAVDLRDYETQHDSEEIDATSTGKDDAPTARANYRFWFQRDCAKLYNTPAGINQYFNLTSSLEGCRELLESTGKTLYFDLESNPSTNTIQCFSYAIGNGPVKTCLVYDYTGRHALGALDLVGALSRAFSRNKIVIHNAAFDLLFLALYHNIPFGPDIEDTMLMQHRIWPESEKSLAHAISLWINSPYHKDSGGTWDPRTAAQQDRLLRYNSRDVATLRAIHGAQWDFVNKNSHPGLRASLVQVNSSIFPYLYTSLHGLPVNGQRLIHYRKQRLAAAAQWQRVINIMAGYDLNPASSQQMGRYFGALAYEVLAKTESGATSVDEGILYKYLLKYRNPLIRAVLKYKRATKVAGELGFKFYTKITKR